MERETVSDMIQSAVRLPRSLHERLKKAGGERGMGEEIRRRLEAFFAAERAPADPKMRELLEAIPYFAEETTNFYHGWSEDAFAFRVLKACVDMWLRRYQPEGNPDLAKPNPTDLGWMVFGEENLEKGEYPNPSPEEISRTIVSTWLTTRAKRAFADEEKRR